MSKNKTTNGRYCILIKLMTISFSIQYPVKNLSSVNIFRKRALVSFNSFISFNRSGIMIQYKKKNQT